MTQNFGPCNTRDCPNTATVRLYRDDYFSKDWFADVCEDCYNKILLTFGK